MVENWEASRKYMERYLDEQKEAGERWKAYWRLALIARNQDKNIRQARENAAEALNDLDNYKNKEVARQIRLKIDKFLRQESPAKGSRP